MFIMYQALIFPFNDEQVLKHYEVQKPTEQAKLIAVPETLFPITDTYAVITLTDSDAVVDASFLSSMFRRARFESYSSCVDKVIIGVQPHHFEVISARIQEEKNWDETIPHEFLPKNGELGVFNPNEPTKLCYVKDGKIFIVTEEEFKLLKNREN